MTMRPDKLTATTTEASAAAAQSRGLSPAAPRRTRGFDPEAGPGTDYELDAAAGRAAYGAPYERRATDPGYRPLKIFTTDPSASRAERAHAAFQRADDAEQAQVVPDRPRAGGGCRYS